MKKLTYILSILLLFVTSAYAADVTITENSKNTKINTNFSDTSERVIKRFKFSKVADELKGLKSIVAERGSYNNPGMGYSFKVDKPVTVYLLKDARLKEEPEGWEKTDLTTLWIVGIKYSDVVYKRDFEPGVIEIPGTPAKIVPYCVVLKAK